MARTPGIQAIGSRLPPSALPPPPDLSVEEAERDLEIVRVMIGVDPQEVLDKYAEAQDRAAAIREEISRVSADLADLKARHWGNGMNPSVFDLERKELLSAIQEKERVRRIEKLKEGGKAPSDTELDKWAHGQKEYHDFLIQGKSEKVDMERLTERKDSLHRRLESALGAIEYYAKAHKSVDSLIYFATQNRRNGA